MGPYSQNLRRKVGGRGDVTHGSGECSLKSAGAWRLSGTLVRRETSAPRLLEVSMGQGFVLGVLGIVVLRDLP